MQKTVPARKPSSPYTRPVNNVNKRFIYVKKQDIRACAATTKEQFESPPEKVEVSNSYDATQPEQNPKVQESSINEAKEETIQVGSSNENKADVLVQVDPDPISNAHTKAENDKDVDLTSDKQDITLAYVVSHRNVNAHQQHDRLPESSTRNSVSESENPKEIEPLACSRSTASYFIQAHRNSHHKPTISLNQFHIPFNSKTPFFFFCVFAAGKKGSEISIVHLLKGEIMCFVFVCDEDERVVGRQAAPGACPYCGGMVQAMDVQSQWRLCFVPLYFRTKRRFYCSICSRRLVTL